MADIRPFRGLRYDTSKCSASEVLAPPYDVIGGPDREALAAKDPNNCVRLILPAGDGDERYANAARTLAEWIESGVLVREDRPAIYRYHQCFKHPERAANYVRKGAVVALRLHSFDERVVLPHERTLKGPKVDRLKLMEATGAHLSQIFTLYSDPSGETDRLFEKVEETPPSLDGTTDDGTRHIVWAVTDRELIGSFARLLAPHKLYIADGHHRYETMLAYRDRLNEGGELPANSSARFGTVFLANMVDPGMIVLPTHRLIHGLSEFSKDELRRRLAENFEVTEVEGGAAAPAVRECLRTVNAPAFVAVFPDGTALRLVLKSGVNRESLGLGGVLGTLDVTVLHTLVLEEILGIDRAAQEAKTNIHYPRDTEAALQQIAQGDGHVLFVLRATPLAHVKAVSDAGEFMPQKSTFFYPKIASGVVFRDVRSDEELD